MKQISEFITFFTMFAIVLIPALVLWWLTNLLDIAWVFWAVVVLSALLSTVIKK